MRKFSSFPAIEDLFSDTDDTLLIERFPSYTRFFQRTTLPRPARKATQLYCLVEKTSELNERDYITRILYKDSY